MYTFRSQSTYVDNVHIVMVVDTTLCVKTFENPFQKFKGGDTSLLDEKYYRCGTYHSFENAVETFFSSGADSL